MLKAFGPRIWLPRGLSVVQELRARSKMFLFCRDHFARRAASLRAMDHIVRGSGAIESEKIQNETMSEEMQDIQKLTFTKTGVIANLK